MQCNRLEKQIKAWYVQVQDEAMAPARMVEFMEKHILDCEICLADEVVRRDVQRITEIILPPAKVRKKAVPKTTEPPPVEAAPESSEKQDVDHSSAEGGGRNSENQFGESEDEYGDAEVDLHVPDVSD